MSERKKKTYTPIRNNITLKKQKCAKINNTLNTMCYTSSLDNIDIKTEIFDEHLRHCSEGFHYIETPMMYSNIQIKQENSSIEFLSNSFNKTNFSFGLKNSRLSNFTFSPQVITKCKLGPAASDKENINSILNNLFANSRRVNDEFDLNFNAIIPENEEIISSFAKSRKVTELFNDHSLKFRSGKNQKGKHIKRKSSSDIERRPVLVDKVCKPKIFDIKKVCHKNRKHRRDITRLSVQDIFVKSSKLFINSDHFTQRADWKILKIRLTQLIKEISPNEKFLDDYDDEFELSLCLNHKANTLKNSRLGSNYKMFPTEDKKFCIELVNKHRLPIEIVSSFCRVPKKSLCRWLSIGAERQKGCGRKLKDPQMEKKLIEWYSQAVQRGLYPSARMIRNKALQFTTAKDFLASKGWLEKFKKKYGITIYNSNVKRKLLDQSSQ